MKTKGKSIFFICLAMIVSGVILFSVIYSGQMVSAAQRVETYKDNGEDKSEMTQESIQSQEKTVREQAEYMEELEEEQNIAHSEILEVMGVRNALAVKMNTIERALQTMTLTKSPQKMFAAYYADGTFNGQESVLYLNQEVVWCLEPSELVGNVGKGITYALADPGDAAQWLQNRYGWSWDKINNLAKAVCFAKQYFGRIPYYHFAKKSCDKKRVELSDLKKIEVMEIREGEFEYEYFNFCYLHNMLSLIIYSLYHNKYPEICVNRGKENVIQWEWYFEPLIDRKKSVTKVKKTLCNKKTNSFFTRI